MQFLIYSILLNAYMGIIFIYFHKFKVDFFQAIVFNYIVCVCTGSFMQGAFPISTDTLSTSWAPWAILMGTLFIIVFNIIANSTIKAGITSTQTANKLSLIIPVIFAAYLYGEKISYVKWAGIFIAFISIIFTVYRKNQLQKKGGILALLLPILLFVSSGAIDTLTKYIELHFLHNDIDASYFVISGFFTAAFWGVLVLILLYVFGKKTFHIKNIIAGILLGIPNYFSIFYLIKALKSSYLSSSAIIPINNIGILFIVSVWSVFICKEKLTKLNYIGLLLSLIAIALIFFGDKIG